VVAGLILAVLLPSSSIHAGQAGSTARAQAAALPAGFDDALVASVVQPTAFAFTPDGRMLITTQTGRLRVYKDGSLASTPALDLGAVRELCTHAETGLLGIAVDPLFSANNFVYVYYTSSDDGPCANRVSRFVLPSSNVIDPVSETVLIDNMPAPDGNHNGGDLEFGRDGLLYISVGDGSCDYMSNSGCGAENDASRDQNVLLGKILRITKEGGIPAGNPFQGAGTERCNVTGRIQAGLKCQETFAWGLRNPFRLAFDPNAQSTRFFINDVGQHRWEEIDEAVSGADYGWNVREGPCREGSDSDCGPPPPGMTNPIFAYLHAATGCASITGGAFVPNGVWPSEYDGDYLYSDYVCGKIFRLEQNGGTYSSSEFVTGLGSSSAVHLRFGPFGSARALYYTTYADGGQVRRISFTGAANRAPTADLTATPTSGPAPLDVAFDGSGSSDPDPGDTLTFVWDFGDGSPVLETAQSATSHRYVSPGTYTASLRVRDQRGATSNPDTVRLDPGNTPPVPTISVPAPTQRFHVGELVNLQGSAVDAQDGPLADSRLSWRVLRHHGTDHTHPWLPETTGNNVAMPAAPAPEDVFSATTSYLEIILTATDSDGLSATTVRELRPRLVDLGFQTAPDGLRLQVFAADVTAPFLLPAWQAWQFGVSAPRQADASGRTWIFDSWSDGGAASHTIVTGTTPTVYTASFHENRKPAASAESVVAAEDVAKSVTLHATDADDDPLTYAVTRPPISGSVGVPTGNQVVYTPGPDFHGGDSFGFRATDGDAPSAEANVAVTVTEVNDPPTAAGDSAVTPEDTSVLIDVRANDSRGPANESSQALAIAGVDDPAHGTAVIDLGRVRFTPDANYAGGDSFGYRVCDDGTTNGAPASLCANGTIGVTVAPVNDPPAAVDDARTTNEDVVLAVAASQLIANDGDVDGDDLAVTAVSGATNGAVSLNAGQVSFAPSPNFNGTAGFDYTISDGHGGSDLGHVAVTVAPVNDPPVAVDDSARTNEGVSVLVDVAANDVPGPSNESGQGLTLGALSDPPHGSAVVDAGKVRYTPDAGWTGADSFTYQVCDSGTPSLCASAQVALTVAGVNHAPVAATGGGGTAEDVPVALTLPASDQDGDTLTFTIVSPPAHGSVGAPVGAVVPYTPDGDFNGVDTFTFRASDGSLQSEVATFSVAVTAVNDPPVPVADVAATAEDTPVVVPVLANDLPGPTNEAGQTLRVSAVGPPAHGTASVIASGPDTGKVRYTPAPDYNGPDSLSYQICDDGSTNGTSDPKCAGSAVAFSFSSLDPPLSLEPPAVIGRLTAGGIARVDPGTWIRGAGDASVQWLRCNAGGRSCVGIVGATGPSYRLRIPDIGRRLRARVTLANRFGSGSALSGPSPVIRSPIVISRIVFDLPGPSEDEWIVLENHGVGTVDLRGWSIRDADDNEFRLGKLALGRGRSAVVETGRGVARGTRRFWTRGGRVWDDRGDTAVLKTPSGARADSCRYRRTRSGAAAC
jgi:glucose/arabinose dehydrogenase